jgi:hypothetical protein
MQYEIKRIDSPRETHGEDLDEMVPGIGRKPALGQVEIIQTRPLAEYQRESYTVRQTVPLSVFL